MILTSCSRAEAQNSGASCGVYPHGPSITQAGRNCLLHGVQKIKRQEKHSDYLSAGARCVFVK